jgi:acyl carrier protein
MINRTEFIEKVIDLFDETDPKEITSQVKFRDLEEWSSLVGMGLMAMVADVYEVSIKAIELEKAQTLEDVANLIDSKKEIV